MIVLEFKLKGKESQYRIIDEMIRTAQFVRNSTLRYWMDHQGVKLAELYKQCAILAKEYEWALLLNSQARQASAERTIFSIQRFFANCKANKPGKKGYPKFKNNTRSVEYKTTGWKLAENKRKISFNDGFKAGIFKLIGHRDLHYYSPDQIKRIRVVRRADGYYCQFCIAVDRSEKVVPTQTTVGIDLGLNHFLTDSTGATVANPRNLKKSEKALKRAHRKVSRKKKGSSNRRKAINRLGRKHLKVSRQRKDFAIKTARCVIQSNDLVVYENLPVRNLVKNHKLAKSINDAAWTQFTQWLEYLGRVYGKIVIPVSPKYTSQECSSCGTIVKKTLSMRTHICHQCGIVLDRDYNAALNILAKGLETYRRASGNDQAWGEMHLCLNDVSPER